MPAPTRSFCTNVKSLATGRSWPSQKNRSKGSETGLRYSHRYLTHRSRYRLIDTGVIRSLRTGYEAECGSAPAAIAGEIAVQKLGVAGATSLFGLGDLARTKSGAGCRQLFYPWRKGDAHQALHPPHRPPPPPRRLRPRPLRPGVEVSDCDPTAPLREP